MYFEKGVNHYYVPVGSQTPLAAFFNNGITNSDLYSTSDDCLYSIPSCTDDVNIYDTFRSPDRPYTWTLRQSLTGL